MRAIRRLFVVPLILAAAAIVAGPAHLDTAAAHHIQVLADPPICPAGSNWDNITQTCD